MTPEEIKQLVDQGAISEDTANYMRSQNAQMSQMMPQPSIAPPPPPIDYGAGGAGGAPGGERFVNPRNGDLGAGGAPPVFGGQGGAPPLYSSPGGGSSGPPVGAPNTPIAPPLQPAFQPSRTVDPASLVMGRPPPVTGGPSAAQAQAAKAKTGTALKNPLGEYGKTTLANFDEQKRNLENRRDFEMVNASMRAAQMQEDERGLSAQDEQRAMQHQQRLQKSDAALADLNARADALSRGKIDPGHWISDDPMHAIAAVFLGMDSPVVQKMIDRDIQSQKDAYERNKDSYLARASNYGHLRELYKDEDMAEAAARVMQIDRAQRKLNVMTASQQPQDISLKTQEAMTTLAQAREDADYKFKAAAYQAQVKASGSSAASLPKALKDVYQTPQGAAEGYKEFLKRKPDGSWPEYVSEAAAAGKGSLGKGGGGGGRSAGVYQNFVNAEAVEEAALRLKDLHKEYGLLDPLTSPVKSAQMRAEMDKLQRMLAPAAARMVHGGAATKEEIEAEKEGMSGHWDPVGTRQKSLDVVIEDARRRKKKLAAGLQQGFGTATEDEEEPHQRSE